MTEELRKLLGQYVALCRVQMHNYAFNAARAWRSGDQDSSDKNAQLFKAWTLRHLYCQRLLESMETQLERGKNAQTNKNP